MNEVNGDFDTLDHPWLTEEEEGEADDVDF